MTIEEAKKELEKFVRLKTTLRPLFVDVILQALEAEPIKHGKWEIAGTHIYPLGNGDMAYEPLYRCTACGRISESYCRLDKPTMPDDADFPNYCPNCGAKMDEVEQP